MNKLKLILLVAVTAATSINAFAQETGVHFEPLTESWAQVVNKAKAENKYIFIDCYATWCGPCKGMDKYIYPNDTVGQFMNSHFISVRLQMDKTKEDRKETKNWYETAGMIEQNYHINAYPSFLFLSPEGEPLDKQVGSKFPIQEFLKMASNAMDPDKQYYRILKNYRPGKLDTGELKGLAKLVSYDQKLSTAIALDYLQRLPDEKFYQKGTIDFLWDFLNNGQDVDRFVANKISAYQPADYIEQAHFFLLQITSKKSYAQQAVKNYLDKLPDSTLLNPIRMNLIGAYYGLLSVHDRYFGLFYRQPVAIDTLMHDKSFAQRLADAIITNRLIQPVVDKSDASQNEPDWAQIGKNIQAQTDSSYVKRNIINARYYFYKNKLGEAKREHSDQEFIWGPKLATALCIHMNDSTIAIIPNNKEKYGMAAVDFNNKAWTVFEYSNNQQELERALFWAKKALAINDGVDAEAIDTKANLLYKLGRKAEAIAAQKQALQLKPKDDGIAHDYQLMMANQPTWPVAKANN